MYIIISKIGDKDTGLSVALFISVVNIPLTKSMVSQTMPCT